MFVETWTLPQEECTLRDFDIIRRIDCNRLNGIGKNGVLIYAKQNISQNVLFLFETKKSTNTRATYQSIAFKYLDTSFIIVYRSPGFPIARFRNEIKADVEKVRRMDNTKVVILGDFNICRSTGTDILEEHLNAYNLFSINHSPTTKQITQIDWIFSDSRIPQALAITYETPYSHHNGIFFKYSL